MTRALALAAVLIGVACRRPAQQQPREWRADCPPIARPAGVGLDAAREAHRLAERRRLWRFREAAAPGSFVRAMDAALDADALAAGRLCLADVDDLGALVFEHEYGYADGLGGGKQTAAGPFRRVHHDLFGGPETISCPSCHWVGGAAGAGAETDNAFLLGDGERTASADQRNPPALVAPGVVEALAREMSHELQEARDALVRDAARAGADRDVRLVAKGVDFGVLRATARGALDTSGLRGVDADLIVKPFGWKGTQAHFADFAAEALQVHLGIQTDVLLARGDRNVVGNGSDPTDPDADGVRDELRRGPFTAMAVHLALLELPIVEPLVQDRKLDAAAKGLLAPTTTSFADDFAHGREVFRALGCAGCHRPMLVLERPVLALDGVPPIDLARDMREPALRRDAALGGYPVWLFSDLKRHDMGAQNAAAHVQNGVGPREYLTPRLWGMADSAPYLHDGRAPSIDYAIAGHDGEGAAARAAFVALPPPDKGALRVYLMSLRRAPRVVVP